MIRVEQSNPMAVINTHNLIANDPQLAPKYLTSQEQEITYFEDIFIQLGDDIMKSCQRRWNTSPYNLKIREYHSPQRVREALNMTPMYKQTILRLKVNWIGLRLNPTLLLGMLEGRKDVGLRVPDPGSALVSQTNPYSTGPFGIRSWSTDRILTRSSMGDAGTKFLHPEMVMMSVYCFYSHFCAGR